MIGVGVGVGFGGVGLSPAWLHSQLVAILGADLIGLWLGEDLVLTGGVVTSWPGRIGGTLTPSHNTWLRSTVNGRPVLAPPTTPVATQRLRLNSGVVSKTAILVVSCVAATPAYETWEDAYTTGQQTLIRNNGASTFYTAGGQVTYVDGVEDADIPASGTHILEGYHATRSNTGITLSGVESGFERVARGSIGAFLALAGEQSAGNRAASAEILQRYYRS